MERATVTVYEDRAGEWESKRVPGDLDDAAAFGRRCEVGAIRVDVGCGPGFHLASLGKPVVALDAARAMLELARVRAPDAHLVQADLEALPFRDRSVGGAWARASYLHVPRARLPLALARLHWSLTVGAPVHVSVRRGDAEGVLASDVPGRFFAEWREPALVDVLRGAGFEAIEVGGGRGHTAEFLVAQAERARTLPDTVGPDMRLLVCGLNPSVYAAERGVGYARPGNRFWPAAIDAGLVTRDRDPLHAFVEHGIGMTDLVKRATRGAAELTADDYRNGVARVERLVRWLGPRAVCFVGLTGWRAAVDPRAVAGEQPGGFAGAPAYVMPNTSGANAHVQLAGFVEHLRRALALAG